MTEEERRRLPERPIQEQFGQRVIDAFADFARADLKTPTELENEEFSHVTNPTLRRHLSEVFYGVRWIYKLGLALLTKDTELAAHVRAQIVDYASVAEGLLADWPRPRHPPRAHDRCCVQV